MRIQPASQTDIEKFLLAHKDWSIQKGKLHREYHFSDFKQAFAYMEKIAELAEAMNHHPEWFNVYNKLVVDLTTHEAQAITARDFELAEKMERLFLS